MENKVYGFIEKQHMFSDGDTVVAGVSGGADSLCLLYLLKEYAHIRPIKLIVAHVHHGLRQNADNDEKYVEAICRQWEIPFRVLHTDAGKVASELGISVEEAGRTERYRFFREILKEEKAKSSGGDLSGKIAIAHNRDDLCETMLFQLFRGSGIHGLRGMEPVTEDLVRPLMCVERDEIEEFLKKKRIQWCVDESNASLRYSRNRIRHEILPVAEAICSGAKEHMIRSAAILRDMEEFLDEEVKKAETEILVKKSGNGILIKNELLNLPRILQSEIIMDALTTVAGRKRDIGTVQNLAVQELFSLQAGKQRQFIYGLKAVREYEGIYIEADTQEETGIREEGCILNTSSGEKTKFRLGEDYQGISECTNHLPEEEIPRDSYTKWINCDTIKTQPVFRHPEKNDYLVIYKSGEKKALGDYLANEKVPIRRRNRIWVLAEGNRVLWVVGYRISEDAKITEDTKRIAMITLQPLQDDRQEE